MQWEEPRQEGTGVRTEIPGSPCLPRTDGSNEGTRPPAHLGTGTPIRASGFTWAAVALCMPHHMRACSRPPMYQAGHISRIPAQAPPSDLRCLHLQPAPASTPQLSARTWVEARPFTTGGNTCPARRVEAEPSLQASLRPSPLPPVVASEGRSGVCRPFPNSHICCVSPGQSLLISGQP